MAGQHAVHLDFVFCNRLELSCETPDLIRTQLLLSALINVEHLEGLYRRRRLVQHLNLIQCSPQALATFPRP